MDALDAYTSTTRTALNKLTRLEGKAPCTDMSEDSMVFDEDDFFDDKNL